MLNKEEHRGHKFGSPYRGRGTEYYTDSREVRFVSLKMFRAGTTVNEQSDSFNHKTALQFRFYLLFNLC
jgi:hypothetical protein